MSRACTHPSAACFANRSAARTFARAFRGIKGSLPAAVSLWRAPSIYSTLPLRSRLFAALSVSHGDRRMRGRTQLITAPDAEGSIAESGSLGNWGKALCDRSDEGISAVAGDLDICGGQTRRIYELLPCEFYAGALCDLMTSCRGLSEKRQSKESGLKSVRIRQAQEKPSMTPSNLERFVRELRLFASLLALPPQCLLRGPDRLIGVERFVRHGKE